jgi:hypothetical protein
VEREMPRQATPVKAFFREFFRVLLRRRKETPEEAILRSFKESYPQWVKDGALKKPD